MESAHLKLELFTPDRISDLFKAVGTDPEVYRWLRFAAPQNFEEFAEVMEGYIQESEQGIRNMYAVILKSTGLPIGTTSFLDLNLTFNSIEIGSTFYAKEYWRSFVNTECKLMMLTEAFEIRGVERVTIKTDSKNQRSRDAIRRLGASFEGILRHQVPRPDGTWRDSAYYSVLKEEWPTVKIGLENKLTFHA